MAGGKNSKSEGLIYRGRPLRRAGNMIYYGTMTDQYIIMMQVLDTKKEQDLDVATKVSVQLQLTAPDLRNRDRVVQPLLRNGCRRRLAEPGALRKREVVLPEFPGRETNPALLKMTKGCLYQ